MVNRFSGCLLMVLGALLAASNLSAKELTAYQLGDRVEMDIRANVPLEVVDAAATAASQAAEALKTPAIFRSYPNPTNAMIREFTGEFKKEQATFAKSLRTAFGEITNAEETIASPAFHKFITSFNHKTLAFPVTTELAGVWARGNDGSAIQKRWLNLLVSMTPRPIRPDDTPDSLPLGDTVRLVVVNSPNDYLNLEDAEQRGELVKLSSVTTVDRLRDLFRREFPRSELDTARAVGKFIRPNCELDAGLTRQARDRDVSQLVVMKHYDIGQIIARRGDVLDAAQLAALTALNAKQPPVPSVQKSTALAVAPPAPASASPAPNRWLLPLLLGVPVLALVSFWLLRRSSGQQAVAVMRPENIVSSASPDVPAQLAPQLTQVLKDAVVQGLAAQRSELLQAQQAAAREIGELVHRLDELKAPMQERLQSYQARIAELEQELADQSKENRELLKAKIEMLRDKIETERHHSRGNFN